MNVEILPPLDTTVHRNRVRAHVNGYSLSWAQVLDVRARARACKLLRKQRGQERCGCFDCGIVKAITKYRRGT